MQGKAPMSSCKTGAAQMAYQFARESFISQFTMIVVDVVMYVGNNAVSVACFVCVLFLCVQRVRDSRKPR